MPFSAFYMNRVGNFKPEGNKRKRQCTYVTAKMVFFSINILKFLTALQALNMKTKERKVHNQQTNNRSNARHKAC